MTTPSTPSSPSGLVRFLTRTLSYAAYYCFARHLPRSYAPGGALGARARRALVSAMVDHAGSSINVEQGARFGSGRGIRVGHRSDLGVDCLVMGSVRIGNDVMMGPRCTIISQNHLFSDISRPMNRQGMTADQPITVEDDVWIGAGCTILAGITVGTGAVVAAGAVVTKDVAPYAIVGGNPAKVISSRHSAAASPVQVSPHQPLVPVNSGQTVGTRRTSTAPRRAHASQQSLTSSSRPEQPAHPTAS